MRTVRFSSALFVLCVIAIVTIVLVILFFHFFRPLTTESEGILGDSLFNQQRISDIDKSGDGELGLAQDTITPSLEANSDKPTIEELEHLCSDIFLRPNDDCLAALDDYFLDSLSEQVMSVRLFLPMEEQMTYRRAFESVIERYQIVKNTLSNEACKVTSGPFRLDLKQDCNADLIAETVFLWTVCLRDREAYWNLDPLTLISLYGDAVDALESTEFQDNEVYLQATWELKERFYREAWIDGKCREIPHIVYEPIGEFDFDYESKLREKKEVRAMVYEQLAAGYPLGRMEQSFNPLDIRERVINRTNLMTPEDHEEELLLSLRDEELVKQVKNDAASYETGQLRAIALRLGNEWAIATTNIRGNPALLEFRDKSRPWLTKLEQLRGSLLRQNDSFELRNAVTAVQDLETYGIEFNPGPIWDLVCNQISRDAKEPCVKYLRELYETRLVPEEFERPSIATLNDLNEHLKTH